MIFGRNVSTNHGFFLLLSARFGSFCSLDRKSPCSNNHTEGRFLVEMYPQIEGFVSHLCMHHFAFYFFLHKCTEFFIVQLIDIPVEVGVETHKILLKRFSFSLGFFLNFPLSFVLVEFQFFSHLFISGFQVLRFAELCGECDGHEGPARCWVSQ